ncbi:MAG TPA: rhamnogalacturonan acetylesterase [Opitutales bacterium]|nr:rhamnogalacturonan acetylesterase [Opitutales bacterium]
MKRTLIFGLLALGLVSCATPPAAVSEQPEKLKPLRLVIIGDSTVCNYPPTEANHREGWGMHIQEYFTDDLTVSNLAASGRSTKTFIQEGRWARALAERPDVVLIQFGHNDSHAPANPEATNAATDFRDYLRQYIDDARAIGAVPILVTPMCRRTATDTLAPYAEAMKIIAAEKNVALIDLHASSARLYAQLGPAETKTLEGGDTTHFNARGAEAMARLVMAELPSADPALKPYLQSPLRQNSAP